MALWAYRREQSLKQSSLVNPKPSSNTPMYCSIRFFYLHRKTSSFLPWQTSLFLVLGIPQFPGHVQLLQQGLQPMCSNISTTFAPPIPEQASQSPLHPWEGIFYLLPIQPLMFFFVCLFFSFFAVGLFKCPTTMQVHPSPGCICPSNSLAKQTTNIFIKYCLQDGDKDLPQHRATWPITPWVPIPF